MNRTRRRVVAATTAGIVGLLAGCTGTGPSDDGSITAATGESGNSTPPATGEPSTVTGRDTATGRETATSQRPPSPNATGSVTTTSDSSAATTVPRGPTSPTADLEILSRSGDLTITEIGVGPPGTDSRSIFEEHVDIENTGTDPVDLAGYTVEYGGMGKSFEIPTSMGTTIDPSGTFRVTSGSGRQTIDPSYHESFAGFAKPVLKTNGGVITVTDPDGDTVLKARY